MKSIDFGDREPQLLHPRGPEVVLAECEAFRLRRLELADGERLEFLTNEEPRILSMVEGSLQEADGFVAALGDTVLLPYAGSSAWVARGPVVALLTDRFNR